MSSCYSATVDLDWTIPYGGPAEICVAPGIQKRINMWIKRKNLKLFFLSKGDIVNFNFHDGHNVEATTQEAFDACAVKDAQPVMGPVAWTAPNEEATTYVICGVALHCEMGNQKVAIRVSHHC